MSGLAMKTVAAALLRRISVPLPASSVIGGPLGGTWLTDGAVLLPDGGAATGVGAAAAAGVCAATGIGTAAATGAGAATGVAETSAAVLDAICRNPSAAIRPARIRDMLPPSFRLRRNRHSRTLIAAKDGDRRHRRLFRFHLLQG